MPRRVVLWILIAVGVGITLRNWGSNIFGTWSTNCLVVDRVQRGPCALYAFL